MDYKPIFSIEGHNDLSSSDDGIFLPVSVINSRVTQFCLYIFSKNLAMANEVVLV
jgi:hypothetical protein